MTDKYQKIPDGNGGFKFIKSDKGTYSKEDLEKKESDLQKKLDKKEKIINERKKEAVFQEKRQQHFIEKQKRREFIIVIVFVLIFSSCLHYLFNSDNEDEDFLNLSREEVYELCNSYVTNSEIATFEECLNEFGY